MFLVQTWKYSCLWFQLPKSIFENNLPFAIISLSQFYCLHIAYKEIKENIGYVSFFFLKTELQIVHAYKLPGLPCVHIREGICLV